MSVRNPLILRRETRKPLVLTLFRAVLKATNALKDPVVRRFWSLSLGYSFRKNKDEREVMKIEKLLLEAEEAVKTLEKARIYVENAGKDATSLRYVTRAAYGQVVFTPRHDAFIQAAYLQKLRLGQRKQPAFPMGGEMMQVYGAAPLPDTLRRQAEKFAEGQTERVKRIYEEMLSEAWP